MQFSKLNVIALTLKTVTEMLIKLILKEAGGGTSLKTETRKRKSKRWKICPKTSLKDSKKTNKTI